MKCTDDRQLHGQAENIMTFFDARKWRKLALNAVCLLLTNYVKLRYRWLQFISHAADYRFPAR